MTMPHLMNCAHSAEGWCLSCVAELDDENMRQRDALRRLQMWADAYPLDIFPEPDFKRAAAVLKAAGMTLDAISASNMRHVIEQTRKIVSAALQSSPAVNDVPGEAPERINKSCL